MNTPAISPLPTPTDRITPHLEWVYILEPTCPAVDDLIHQQPSSALPPSPLSPVNHAVALSNEFGKSSGSQDLLNLISSEPNCQIKVRVCHISLQNYRHLLDEFDRECCQDRSRYVVVNLCDGCETDGYPGVSVIQEMEKRGIAFTGSDSAFYLATTSKPEMKRVLQDNNVPTSPFLELTEQTTESEVDETFKTYPLIVKPSISYASIAISDKSVVFSAKQTLEQASQVHGVGGGVFAERFLAGREFTALITGSRATELRVYPVAERVFNPKLQEYQRILAFDRYWDGYDLQGHVPKKPQQLYWYRLAPEEMQIGLQDFARRAYLALGGNGYGRVDMRTSSLTDDWQGTMVLEVNANCGVSFNPDEFTSTVGEILRMSGTPVRNFAWDLIKYAVQRRCCFTTSIDY